MTKSTQPIREACVRDVMSREVVSIQAFQTMSEAAETMAQHNVSAVPVVDEAGRCIGILTSNDMVRFEAQRHEACQPDRWGMEADLCRDQHNEIHMELEPFDRVQRYMSDGLQSAAASTSLTQAGQMMRRQNIHHLPVLDETGRPLGMVSSLDLIGGRISP